MEVVGLNKVEPIVPSVADPGAPRDVEFGEEELVCAPKTSATKRRNIALVLFSLRG